MNVSVLPGSDRQLVDLVRACGVQVTIVSLDDLATLAHKTARQPSAIVVDQRERTTIPAELAALKRMHPSTGVLMVLPRLDGALVLEAMRVGANECVADPVTRDDLNAALERIAAQLQPSTRGDVFAILGAKGGVGATTVAVNVATMLNKLRPGSTLMMDLHMTYGDAGIFLGAEPRFSTCDALENMHRMDAKVLRGLITETRSGLQLLASSDHLVSTSVDVGRLRALIDLASAEFPYVVLDVPRSDTAVLDSLGAVSAIVIVANQEVATVRGAARIARALEQRYGKDRVSIVIMRHDAKAQVQQQDVERVTGRSVSHLFPNDYPSAIASLNNGRPLVLDNHNKLASALSSFTHTLAQIPAGRPVREKTSGMFSFIGGRRLAAANQEK
jgi:pilus assembly protein CpaE